jgi:hypothetical protein
LWRCRFGFSGAKRTGWNLNSDYLLRYMGKGAPLFIFYTYLLVDNMIMFWACLCIVYVHVLYELYFVLLGCEYNLLFSRLNCGLAYFASWSYCLCSLCLSHVVKTLINLVGYSLWVIYFVELIIRCRWCSIFASNKVSIYKSSPQGLVRYHEPFDTKYHSKFKR